VADGIRKHLPINLAFPFKTQGILPAAFRFVRHDCSMDQSVKASHIVPNAAGPEPTARHTHQETARFRGLYPDVGSHWCGKFGLV
jgi:hypothetical protein